MRYPSTVFSATLLEFPAWELHVDVHDPENLTGSFMDRPAKSFKKTSNSPMLKRDKFDFRGNFMCINSEGLLNNTKTNVATVKKKLDFWIYRMEYYHPQRNMLRDGMRGQNPSTQAATSFPVRLILRGYVSWCTWSGLRHNYMYVL